MNSVDQKLAAVKSLLERLPQLFRRQGAVVATYRTVDGRKLRPYFSLRYREEGRQRSVYLGRSAELADKVRNLFARLHRPVRRVMQIKKFRAAIAASLRRHKKIWERDLKAELSLLLKGFEVRGWRSASGERRAESQNGTEGRGESGMEGKRANA